MQPPAVDHLVCMMQQQSIVRSWRTSWRLLMPQIPSPSSSLFGTPYYCTVTLLKKKAWMWRKWRTGFQRGLSLFL
eukprot:g2800.t1